MGLPHETTFADPAPGAAVVPMPIPGSGCSLATVLVAGADRRAIRRELFPTAAAAGVAVSPGPRDIASPLMAATRPQGHFFVGLMMPLGMSEASARCVIQCLG